MIAQYTQAAIVSELKRLAVPASVDSIPSSAMQEDHVSMGWSAARKLRRSVDGLTRVVAIEVLTAARALDLRAPLGRRRRPAPWSRLLRSSGVEGPGPTATSRPRSRPPSSWSPRAPCCAAAEAVVGRAQAEESLCRGAVGGWMLLLGSMADPPGGTSCSSLFPRPQRPVAADPPARRVPRRLARECRGRRLRPDPHEQHQRRAEAVYEDGTVQLDGTRGLQVLW